MQAFSALDKALQMLKSMYDKTHKEIVDIELVVVDEKSRVTASRKMKHPFLSSTSLSEARTRAAANHAKMERSMLEAMREAIVAQLAFEQAEAHRESIEQAIKREDEEKLNKDRSGLYKHARNTVDRLYDLGVGDWDYRHISERELEMFADLLMWKAKDRRHSEDDTPWKPILNIYDGRELGHKTRSLPLVSTEIPPLIATPDYRIECPSFIPTRAELEAYLAEKAQLAPADLDEDYGGVVFMPSYYGTSEVLPMWSREDRGQIGGSATLDDWYRFSVPRGPYVVIHNNDVQLDLDAADEHFPPYERLSLLGVELELGIKDMGRLKAAEEGRGSVDLAVQVVRHFTQKLALHDTMTEHLTRFWLFLLLGRHHPGRVDRLFPHGYFHKVVGADPAVEGKSGGFTIIRSTKTDDNGHAMSCSVDEEWLRQKN